MESIGQPERPTEEQQTIAGPAASEPGWRRAGGALMDGLRTLMSAGIYATLIVTFVCQVARVDGQSMEPTLEDQDRLIVNKLAYRLHPPQVGDVVMHLNPDDPSQAFVKRVVAGPGDTVSMSNGRVFRNGVPVEDDYIPDSHRSHEDRDPEVIRAGHYYVLGDHRNNSSDSRIWGLVPEKYIVGKIQVRWWPLNRTRWFSP